MDGDVAPLSELNEVCGSREALLVVDDAHGFGVLGDNGIGSLEAAGLPVGGGLLMLGTLGKSVGSFGAFVAGDAVYIESLVQFARAYIYTTALPPSVVAASRAAIRVFRDEPELLQTLRQNIDYFRQAMDSSPLRLAESVTPIQPLIVGGADAALRAAEFLKQEGIWVAAIRPPTIPVGTARLRITLSAAHTSGDIDRLVESLGSDTMSQIGGARS